LKNGKILLIECKYNARASSERIDYLRKLSGRAGARPIIAVKKKYEKNVRFIDVDSGGEVKILGFALYIQLSSLGRAARRYPRPIKSLKPWFGSRLES